MKENYPKVAWTPEKVNRFWDWQSRLPENYFTNRHGKKIVRFLKNISGDRTKVLDFGCGVGFLLPHLWDAFPGAKVYGVDPSSASVESANKLMESRGFQSCAYSPEELATENIKFDLILIIEVVEHLDDSSLQMVCSEVKGLLAPGGVAVFTTPNDEDLSENEVLCPDCCQVFHRWQHIRNWSGESLKTYLNDSGFNVKGVYETDFNRFQKKFSKGWWTEALKQIFLNRKSPHLACVAEIE